MINIFVGYDPREAVAFSVLAYSIQIRASQPVSIAPLMLSQLKDIYTRERHPLQSTDFSYALSRPHLSGYTGWSLFMDCDMLVPGRHRALTARRALRRAGGETQPCTEGRDKFLGATQTRYEKRTGRA